MNTNNFQYHENTYHKRHEDYQKAYENYELEYWSNKFGVTIERLKQAIAKVGLSADAVEHYLKNIPA